MLMKLLILIIVNSSESKLVAPEDEITEEMKAYIKLTKVSLSNVYDTVGLINTDEEYTRAILDYFLKYKNIDAVLIGNRSGKYIKFRFLERTPNLFCFVNTIQHFEVSMAYIKINPFFKLNGFIQFVVGKPVTNKDWLRGKLEYIWSNDVLNFVIVFQINKTIEVIGYNPFDHSYYNFTNHKKGISIYPNKLDNLHEYKLYIAMMDNFPMNVYTRDTLIGEDVNRIQSICKIMNATYELKIYASWSAIRNAILQKEANFSFVKHFAISNSASLIQPSYPLQMDYIVMAVPKADPIPHYLYLFMVFGKKSWTSIFISIAIVAIFAAFFSTQSEEKYKDPLKHILAVFQIFIQISFKYSITGKRWSLKLLYISWVFFSLLVTSTFNTALRSSLINIKYNKDILTLQELKESGLPIGANLYIFKNNLDILETVKDQIVNMNGFAQLNSKFAEFNKDMAFTIPLAYAKLMNKKDKNQRYFYHYLDEELLSGYWVYNFPHNSPFLSYIENLIRLDNEFGISLFGIPNVTPDEIKDTSKIPLQMQHVVTAFAILVIGLFAGFCIFIVELVVYKRHERKRK